MHLIMNALEEVTSCAHPNVSEISLLITLMSVTVLSLNLPKKKKGGKNSVKLSKLRCPTTVLITALSFLLFRMNRAPPLLAPSEDTANTSQLPAAFLLW